MPINENPVSIYSLAWRGMKNILSAVFHIMKGNKRLVAVEFQNDKKCQKSLSAYTLGPYIPSFQGAYTVMAYEENCLVLLPGALYE